MAACPTTCPPKLERRRKLPEFLRTSRRSQPSLPSFRLPAFQFHPVGQSPVIERNYGKPVSDFFAFPPPPFIIFGRCEFVLVPNRPDIPRRMIGKWVAGKQLQCKWIVVEQLPDEMNRPRIFIDCAHRGKPHLPIEMQLVRGNNWRHLLEIDRYTPVRIFLPVGVAIRKLGIGAFEDYDVLFSSDAAKRPVSIHQFEWIERGIHDLVLTD